MGSPYACAYVGIYHWWAYLGKSKNVFNAVKYLSQKNSRKTNRTKAIRFSGKACDAKEALGCHAVAEILWHDYSKE